MDIEQLQLLLKTIETLGGDAREFGIWFLVCQAVSTLICNVLWVSLCAFLICGVFKVIKYGILVVNIGYRVANQLNIPLSGQQQNVWTPTTSNKVTARIGQLLDIERASKG